MTGRDWEELDGHILRLIENNLNRPIASDVLCSQMEGAYSPTDVRRAIWDLVRRGVLDFNQRWEVVRLSAAPEAP